MGTVTPNYRSVQQLLQSQSFAIDEYQREYKWEKENVLEMISDFLDKFQNSYQDGDETTAVNNYTDYFLGSIIVTKRNGAYYLIDGQQRVTTLTLLLIYLYREAKHQALPVHQIIAPLIYSDNFGKPSFNLNIRERLSVLEALFDGTPYNLDGKDESIRSMYDRYQDILLRDLAGELDSALPHFIYWLLNKVGMIVISTDNDSYAYAIFETMNDRGKPLSPVDMMKAFVLAPVEDVDKRRHANSVWKKQVLDLITWGEEQSKERDSACIKAWLRAQYAESIRDRRAGSTDKDWELIGSVFHRWTRDNASRLALGTEKKNLLLVEEEFPFFARAYKSILDAGTSLKPGWEVIYYNAHNDFTWQNTVLLAPLCLADHDDLVRRKIAVVATYLDIWIMRRVVNYIRVSYSAVSYAMYLLCKDIRKKPLDELVQLLTKRLAQDDITFEAAPKKGREGLSDLRLNQFSRRYIYHLLARVTAFVEEGSGKANMFADYVDRSKKNAYDIEHIWADNYSRYSDQFTSNEEFQRARNHVAGLLLLPADVNRSLNDLAFEKKAPHYAKQNLFAASLAEASYQHSPKFRQFMETNDLFFKHYSTFGRSEQHERRELLAAVVDKVWSPDRIRSAAYD
ncbi:DUF262 domain-containing protein [Pelovirga terrestris]|uniref:DUF262 domain-containing protein n=1 Tax=Pelovirga terrestris TaxID=2771352 RepID=A0A8J6R4P7_9BACT|nr:DUF262 domain-containing protein [Pelovirga terrestris]MBD1399444.1 DUF262 domain-containing protein [Pelovirga terrestris]